MWKMAFSTKSALALLMAAGVAFLGVAMLLELGRTLPQLPGAGTGAGRPGTMVLGTAILLAVAGALLVVMASREILDGRRSARARAGRR